MHGISVLLGLVFAWVILFFIGPKPRVSYYQHEEPVVVGMAMSELDAMMMAVGLLSEAPEPKFSLSPAPAPAPVLSVADMAMSPAPMMDMPPSPSLMMNMPPSPSPVMMRQSVADLDGQDTAATPPASAPSPAPSPVFSPAPSPQN